MAPSVLASLTYDTEAGQDFVMYLSDNDFSRGLPDFELTPARLKRLFHLVCVQPSFEWFLIVMQASLELQDTKRWAQSHVADNCCFHYRRVSFGL